ncbi:MAG TPA: DUF4166 domain-containing protein [Rickettsiales bacterium]|nr:DUF4166 domain-containing protein [Rickettsiales bacterium]
MTKILILGGYGTFGGRLAQLLADEPRLTLVIAGRSHRKAEQFCNKLFSAAALTPLAIDRNGNLEEQLKLISPDIVVDASGPFQAYGNDPYRVVKACIALGIHYLDLADGSDFVKNIRQFDDAAKQRGLFILSGASSFPVLTSAVVRHLAQGMDKVKTITAGIAPSPYAGVGLNVIRAVMSYAGKPISLIRNGRKAIGYGLTETMRYTIAPPGKLPLRNLHFSLVDVPDLQLLPDDYPALESIWIGVAPVPAILHRMLNALAVLVKKGLMPSLLPYAGFMHRVINILRWGEHRGGMFVSVTGTDSSGVTLERSWHMLAEGDDGPMIPSMAVEGIIRKLLGGETPSPGARAATLELSDYNTLFRRRTIYTGVRNLSALPENAPLYQRMLQDAWQELPPAIRDMHTLYDTKSASGKATVERGPHPLARFVAACIGFPSAGEDVPVTVTFRLENRKEIWQRNFAGQRFHSIQSEGTGRMAGLLCEQFGPFTFGLALVLKEGRLTLIVRRWSLCGIPLPASLAPSGESFEYADNGRFRFHVEIKHPLTGLIVRYRGWLE